MSPPLLPQDITMTSETEETVLDLVQGALKIFHDIAAVDIGESEADEDHFRNSSRTYALAGPVTVGDIRKAALAYEQLAALSRAPEAEDTNQIGAAEAEVGRYIYQRGPLPVTDLDIIIRAAERTRAELADFADGKHKEKPMAESYHAVVQDIGAFGVFINELRRLQSVLAALSPPSTGGEGEAWDRIPPAKRFGRRLDESAVKHLAPGTLLRFYSEDPWFDPSPSSPANGDIVVFTGEVSNTFPKVGPHLEVRTLGGRVYPGGGWVYQIFQFVADPSPEMGEISREEIAEAVHRGRFPADREPTPFADEDLGGREYCFRIADQILKLKENGLSREELGGLAQSLPSGDAQERSPVPPLSDGGQV